MNIRFNIFRKRAVAYGVDVKSEVFFKAVGPDIARLLKEKSKLAIGLNMPSLSLYVIIFTAHTFNDYIRAWIELVNECDILSGFTLGGALTTFNPYFSLEKVSKGDEGINNDLSGQELPRTKNSQNVYDADWIILQGLAESSDDLGS